MVAVPVFFTGEGAEESVEHLPGVSEGIIERHEGLAKLAFGVVSASSIVSLIGILFYGKTGIRKLVRPIVLILSFATAGIMVVTAHLGGQIRHTEIRSGFTTQTENGAIDSLQSKQNNNDNE